MLKEIEPIEVRKTMAFVTRAGKCGGLEEVDLPIYAASENGTRLRAMRREHGVSLWVLADRAGLNPSDVSLLERGARDTDERGWAELFGYAEQRP